MIGKNCQKITAVSYEDLTERLDKNNFYNRDKIDMAYRFASRAHEGQKRHSGVPYITHPLYVACILVDLGMDTDSICAALLHDVVEDTPVELSEIKKLFGATVALLIDGVTKIGKVPFFSKEETQAENIRKMLLAMAKDIRVIIIKLADRLHNMRTLQFMSPQKRLDKAHETMEIYAPLAHRLGIKAIKDEMEDISIRYLDPIGYKEIERALAKKSRDRDKLVMIIKEQIKRRLQEFIPNVQVTGRVKSINGIYRKMFFQNRLMEQIYDIYAVRIIVNNVNDCYNALGIVHDMYTPIPSRFKDYISTPKANMYQSLHTTVLGKEHIPFEVQIRTWEMHRTAEYGIAAHWKYKTGVQQTDAFENRLSWIKNILELQDKTDTTGFITAIKTDLSSDEVIVLTPAGDAVTLPKGSTPIDFAYAIHSAVGNSMIGAKIDGKIVPIGTKLRDGQIVQILTSKDKNHGPGRDWLGIVKTNQARNKIRQWFKKEHYEENINIGKSELEFEFRKCGIRLVGEEGEKFLAMLCKRQRCKNLSDFYAAIGYGGIVLSRLMPRIKDDYLKLKKPEEIKPVNMSNPLPRKASDSVLIEGVDNCLIHFAKCCNPLPGDKIIGFITRGNGVSIHNKQCRNVPKDTNTVLDPKRWIKAQWNSNIKEYLDSTLEIQVANRKGMLADVTQAFSDMHLFINSLNTRNLKDGKAVIYATITVNSLEHLRSISSRLKRIRGIISINRI